MAINPIVVFLYPITKIFYQGSMAIPFIATVALLTMVHLHFPPRTTKSSRWNVAGKLRASGKEKFEKQKGRVLLQIF